MRVLVAEDEPLLADTIADGLRRRSMAVDVCYDGDAALERVMVHRYDVVILDRDLPRVHGDEVCRTIVASGGETRVLMLTAAAGIRDRVDGLDLGADDYLTKPFAFAELLARIEALLRRRPAAPHTTRLKVEDLEFDLLARRVTRGGREVELTARELKLLEFLMRRAGQVVTRTMLLEGVWDLHFDPQSNLIDVHISRLRQAIDRGTDHPLIHTVRGSGYVLRSDN